MQARWIRKRTTHLLVGLLLLPALAARMLVPPGFMPGTGADDAPTMQMCHGAGPLPAPALQTPMPIGDDPAPGRGRHHEPPCVFAAAGSAAPPPVATFAPCTQQAADDTLPTPDLVFVQRTLHRVQAARAPPGRDLQA